MPALLLGGAVAQANPSYRTAPATPTTASTTAPMVYRNAPVPAKITTTPQNNDLVNFGVPRVGDHNGGRSTRISFDVLDGVTYTLTPTASGLRIQVTGARVIPALSTQPGVNVREYRAGGGQAMLITPHPLSLTRGWRATESRKESGIRVLTIDLGRQLQGGADMTTTRFVRTTPQTQATQAGSRRTTTGMSPLVKATQQQINQAWTNGQSKVPATPPQPSNTASNSANTASTSKSSYPSNTDFDGKPPGDNLPPLPNVTPRAIGSSTATPSAVSDVVPGYASGTAVMSAPRIGPHPGMTRMVLDLPPGTRYQVIPSGLGLRVQLNNVTASAASDRKVSKELKGWKLTPTANGVNLEIVTGTPTTKVSGWRADLLPPAKGNKHRLVLDLSPAFADISPLNPREKKVGSVPPIATSSGLGAMIWQSHYTQPRVLIDPGHGGKDPGAVGSVIEKQVNLEVAKRVRNFLRPAGVNVVLTRETDRALHPSKNTDLATRGRMAKRIGAQLFVSIHANAMPARTRLRGFGVETWWNRNHPHSKALAQTLQHHMTRSTSAFDRGVKGHQSLSVLRNNSVPAALVEVGFTSHPIDGLNLLNNAYLDRISLGIANGIREALLRGITADGLNDDVKFTVTERPDGSSGVGGSQ